MNRKLSNDSSQEFNEFNIDHTSIPGSQIGGIAGRDIVQNQGSGNIFKDIVFNIFQAKQIEVTQEKITFDTFITIVSQKYGYIERLPSHEVHDLWNLLNNPYRTKFQNAEINPLKLVIRYCCFAREGWNDPQERRKLKPNDYYAEAKKLVSDPKLRNICRKLSKIVEDRKISAILRQA